MGAPAANPPGAAKPGAPPSAMPPPRQWGQPAQPAQPGQPQGQALQGHPGYSQPGYGQPGPGAQNQTQYGQAPYQQPDQRTMGYQNPVPPAAAPVAVPESRKPIGLLIGAVVLLLAVVAGGTVMVVKGRERTQGSVIVAQNPSLPQGPGTLQSEAPAAPAGPGVLTNRTAPPPSAPAVTGSTKQPDDMAPSVLLGAGQTPPTAPSVVSGATTPQAPAAPVTAAPAPTPAPPAPPVTAAPQRTPAPVKPAPKPAAPPDNRDFEAYLEWLRFVEQERVALQNQGAVAMLQQSFSPITRMLEMAENPEVNDNVLEARDQQRRAVLVRDVQVAMRRFHMNVMRTKPRVPADCLQVDGHFMAAMQIEQQVELATLQAFARNDLARLMTIKQTGTKPIYARLRQANFALRQVFRSRNLPEIFEITDSSSGLGNMFQGMF